MERGFKDILSGISGNEKLIAKLIANRQMRRYFSTVQKLYDMNPSVSFAFDVKKQVNQRD